MLSYIASNSTAELIKSICNEMNITILNHNVEELDFLEYIKQTKVNFNLIKFFIIDLSQIKNTEDEIINSIRYFKELYLNTRVIIIARGYDNQNKILTSLYENKIFNLINDEEDLIIQTEIKKCLSIEGLQEKDVKRFKKVEEVQTKKKSKKQKKALVKDEKKEKIKQENEKENIQTQQINSVYFFAILLEAITRLIKFISYVLVFSLTSIGLTILLNSELRELVFQILGLK